MDEEQEREREREARKEGKKREKQAELTRLQESLFRFVVEAPVWVRRRPDWRHGWGRALGRSGMPPR